MKFLTLLVLGLSLFAKDPYFFEKPYLQLGDRPKIASEEGLDLMWIGHDKEIAWTVEYKTSSDWIKATPKMLRRINVPGTAAHRVYSAPLVKLKPGEPFTYRISTEGKTIFEASAIARKSAKSASHFVVFGDCAADTPGQRAVAYQVAKEKPDYIFITGDIVYSRGKVSEYQTKFWPVYNSDQADPKTGAPLLRSTLFTGVIGNHDSQPVVDFDTNPDGLAFYHYWSLPLNGPALTPGAKNTPELKGGEATKTRFLASASSFPRMANYSFDYGSVHWTVIDSNPYVDWSSPELREWVQEDLKAAAKAKWRIVAFHHPPFNSSKAHFKEQRIRLLSSIFEAGKVDLVLSGHVHNYQRTHPLTFEIEPGFILAKGATEVPGKWTLDKSFDGEKNTHPKGVLYVITGAGGANLYNKEQNGDPSSWLDFTNKFVSDVHSFTVIDAEARQLKFRQVSAGGKELDRFTISR